MPEGMRGAFDGGTAIVVLLWFGILLLVPSRPVGEAAAPPAPPCMIVARSEPLTALPLARRPDLVTMPSVVSFGAAGPAVDSLQGVPPLRHYAAKPLPPLVSAPPPVAAATQAAALRQAAAALTLPPVLTLTADVGATIPVSMTGWRVLGSPALGDTSVSATFKATFHVPAEVKRFEADLWIRFDEGGNPVEIYVERCENRGLVKELVRHLSNPVNWTGAGGQGRMTIRYLAATGESNANTNN